MPRGTNRKGLWSTELGPWPDARAREREKCAKRLHCSYFALPLGWCPRPGDQPKGSGSSLSMSKCRNARCERGMHSDGATGGQVLRKLDLVRARRPQKGAGRPKEGSSTQAQEKASTGPSPTGRWPNMALGPCARRLPHGKRPRPGRQPEESTQRLLVSKRRVALGPKRTRCLIYGVWAHIDTALGPDAATTCDAARYAGKCIDAGSVHVAVGTLRRSRQRGYHTDACTEVNIVGAGTTGHARKATTIKYSAVGAGQCTA